MVSGYDKTPPDPSEQPQLGAAGFWFVIAACTLTALAGFGWIFV